MTVIYDLGTLKFHRIIGTFKNVIIIDGTLIQILDKPRGARSRFSATFGGKSSDKEAVRQCFLFSKHLLLTTRQSGDDGRLNLVPQIGKIPLSDAVLVEDPNEQNIADDDGIITLLSVD
ncbi:hypothetical protein E2986_12809 [Frieseomelitta varia]|uniref:Uncharacterized protein n=1 Tax=Frieseomelitta varia TaxID=561572 RepID=A0A833W6A6_9HYME|nr:hypothetical protein E2986_12809 [Frieseomelitta varia]